MKKLLFLIICIGITFFGMAQKYKPTPNKLSIPFNVYIGNLHSHTSYSDGVGTPADAFGYAKNTAHVDFLAVTDHLDPLLDNPENWEDTKSTADDSTINGFFVGIAGYEWTSGTYNHSCVFNMTDLIPTSTYDDLTAFYNNILSAPPAFAQYNHPGRDVTLNWNNFSCSNPSIDSAFPLIEVREFSHDSFYQMALDSGRFVSPVANQDNHGWTWGNVDGRRSGIWATELTRASLFEAIMARRTFATLDSNAIIWADLDSYPMGSNVIVGATSNLHIYLEDADLETFTNIIVLGSDKDILFSWSNRSTSLDTTIILNLSSQKWIFVRGQQEDGQYIWSAPFFISPTATVFPCDDTKDTYNVSVYRNSSGIKIKLVLNKSEQVEASIFNLFGQKIADSYQQKLMAGVHEISFSIEKDSRTMNILNLRIGNSLKTIKLI